MHRHTYSAIKWIFFCSWNVFSATWIMHGLLILTGKPFTYLRINLFSCKILITLNVQRKEKKIVPIKIYKKIWTQESQFILFIENVHFFFLYSFNRLQNLWVTVLHRCRKFNMLMSFFYSFKFRFRFHLISAFRIFNI